MLVRFNKRTIIGGTIYTPESGEVELANDIADQVVAAGNGVVVGFGAYSNEARLSTDANGNTVLVGADGTQYPVVPPSYTWASRPDATTPDVDTLIRITDVGVSAFGSLWYTDGTRWRPVGDRLVLGNVAFAGTTNGTNTETIGYELALPAGLLQTGDEISVSPYVFKSGGTSDSGTVLCRIGATQGTLGSTLWLTMAQPATTNLRAHARWAWGKASATVLHYLSLGGASAAGGTTPNAQNDVTVPNLDTQTTYFQVTTKLTTGGTETLTLKSCPVVLECR